MGNPFRSITIFKRLEVEPLETKLITLEKEQADSKADMEAIAIAGKILKQGGLVAFPTETVYGLGGDALNPQSSRKIYTAKGRPSDNPLIVHIYRIEDLENIAVDIPKEAYILAEKFWPGPLTMILKKSDRVPKETTGGLQTVAIRMPKHPAALKLIQAAGGYVAAPSANRSGRPSPTLAKYVIQDMDGRIDMILDGGQALIGLESTIVDLTSDKPMILRPGYITGKMIEEAVGSVTEDVTMFSVAGGQAPKAPGMKYKHYAPKGEVIIVEGEAEKVVPYINEKTIQAQSKGERVGVIATLENQSKYHADFVKNIGSRLDEEMIAGKLFQLLREFDDEEATIIYSEAFFGGNLGQAIMNRLLKAAGHHIEKV